MILVLGSGVAGLSCALAAVRAGTHVKLVTPGLLRGDIGDAARALAGGNTALAQGGIAAALGAGDTAANHVADTIGAGVGLVDRFAADALAHEGVAAVQKLLAAGLLVDRDHRGAPRLGLEAAHGVPRIVHAGGDRTGAILHEFLTCLVLACVESGQIELLEEQRVVGLVKRDGAVCGAVLESLAEDTDRGSRASCATGSTRATHSADAVVIATGGYAALYPRTSNHSGARGEGIVLAARAGAAVADLEFVQFHPTVLAGTGDLVSEAVRGAGARLLDGSGRQFMREADPRAELAPRDVVSREIHRLLRSRGDSAVWLDATGIEREGGAGSLRRRFPGISAVVATQGFCWEREPIPVSPAAHYTMGGVLSDLDGRSTLPGLYVAGEAAATGVHGANRLASNSLLEGLVFGARAGLAASHSVPGAWELRGQGAREVAEAAQLAMANPLPEVDETPLHPLRGCQTRESSSSLAVALTDGLGIERDAEGLAESARVIAQHAGSDAQLAAMIHTAASARTESRGAHQRRDFPRTDPSQATRRAFRFIASTSTQLSGHSHGVPELRSLSSC